MPIFPSVLWNRAALPCFANKSSAFLMICSSASWNSETQINWKVPWSIVSSPWTISYNVMTDPVFPESNTWIMMSIAILPIYISKRPIPLGYSSKCNTWIYPFPTLLVLTLPASPEFQPSLSCLELLQDSDQQPKVFTANFRICKWFQLMVDYQTRDLLGSTVWQKQLSPQFLLFLPSVLIWLFCEKGRKVVYLWIFKHLKLCCFYIEGDFAAARRFSIWIINNLKGWTNQFINVI